MKKILTLVIILLVALLAVVTRPEKKAHKEAMMKAVKEYVDEEASNQGFGDNVLTNLGKGVVNKVIEAALASQLKVNDYYLFNTTYVKLKGEEKMLSVGLFGHVFTFDKKMLRDALKEAANNKSDSEEQEEE